MQTKNKTRNGREMNVKHISKEYVKSESIMNAIHNFSPLTLQLITLQLQMLKSLY